MSKNCFDLILYLFCAYLASLYIQNRTMTAPNCISLKNLYNRYTSCVFFGQMADVKLFNYFICFDYIVKVWRSKSFRVLIEKIVIRWKWNNWEVVSTCLMDFDFATDTSFRELLLLFPFVVASSSIMESNEVKKREKYNENRMCGDRFQWTQTTRSIYRFLCVCSMLILSLEICLKWFIRVSNLICW